MPYFPTQAQSTYRCQGCGGWFVPSNMSCGVAHAPGTCCHHYETRTSAPKPAALPRHNAADVIVYYDY